MIIEQPTHETASPRPEDRQKYRAEIDGLRALAVIPVILFHAGARWFDGGYVGVDVFFVISGYLITTIILGEKQAGKFSITAFYERRARRILPALFFVMPVCMLLAWRWMVPTELVSFCESVIGVFVFASNVLFWRTSGYFDTEAAHVPLLHTWSLGVEEQYYFLFPVFIILLWRLGLKRLVRVVSAVALASLAVSHWASRHHVEANFYLAPTRAWELLIGSILAILAFRVPLHQRVGRVANNLLSGLGLALVIGSIFLYGSSTPFPSLYALAPTIGSALVIGFAAKDTLTAKVLSLKWVVRVGLVSYSAYLWHQPLFAFARIHSVRPLSPLQYGGLSALTMLLAYVTWRFVETPFRDRRRFTRKHIFVGALVGSCAFLGLGLIGRLAGGFPGRFTPVQQELISFQYNFKKDSWKEGSCFLRPEQSSFGDCVNDDSAELPSVVLWGDSHAAHLYPGLKKSLAGTSRLTYLSASACPPILDLDFAARPYCRKVNDLVLDRITKEHPGRVILAARWTEHDWTGVSRTLRKLHKAGIARIDLVGPAPLWYLGLPVQMSRLDVPVSELPKRTSIGLLPGVDVIDDQMRRFAGDHGVKYISLMSILCDKEGCLTRAGDRADQLIEFDSAHFSDAGSEYVVSQFPR